VSDVNQKLLLFTQNISIVGEHIHQLHRDLPDRLTLWDQVADTIGYGTGTLLQKYFFSVKNSLRPSISELKRLQEMFVGSPEFLLIAVYRMNNGKIDSAIDDLINSSDVVITQVTETPRTSEVVMMKLQLEQIRQEKDRLAREIQDMKEKTLCVICFDRKINVLLYPWYVNNLPNFSYMVTAIISAFA
jgi:hypothetical protein